MIDTHIHVMQAEPCGQGLDLEDYRREMQRVGIVGAFIVQPSAHKFDTRVTLEAVGRFPELFKAVVVVPTSVGLSELVSLKARGVVGVRLNVVSNPEQAALPDEDFLKRVRDAGLFVQVFAGGESLARLVEMAVELRFPLVVDHLGNPSPALGFEQVGYREMAQGARERRIFVKLSAPFRIGDGKENYAAASRFARDALGKAPVAQFVAGTDWPFINCKAEPSMEAVMGWLRGVLPRDSDWEKVTRANVEGLLGGFSFPLAQ